MHLFIFFWENSRLLVQHVFICLWRFLTRCWLFKENLVHGAYYLKLKLLEDSMSLKDSGGNDGLNVRNHSGNKTKDSMPFKKKRFI